jgi:hypothetical protein
VLTMSIRRIVHPAAVSLELSSVSSPAMIVGS